MFDLPHSQHFKTLSGAIIQNKKYQGSAFLRDALFFPARSHLSKSHTQILHQHCVSLSGRHPDAVVLVYGSLISHICDNISPRVGCRASLIRSRFYCCFSSSLAVTERSAPGLYRAKLCFYTMSTPMQDHFTPASR